MSRKHFEAHPHRPLLSIITGLASLVAVAACGANVDSSSGTETATAQEQALTEAQSSYADAKAAAEACFATFETCKSAADADVEGCRTALRSCLPAKAGAGPHCGGDRGTGGARGDHGPGECDGGSRPPVSGGDAPQRPEGSGPGAGAPRRDGPPRGPEGGQRPGEDGEGRRHPDFCKRVPLPPPSELAACHDALKTCLAGGGDRKACFDADRACVKAAFDAAFQALCAATDKDERLTKLCAGGVAPPAP